MKPADFIAAALGVMFVGLKLTHYIDWSWWWILAPFWAPLGLFGAIFVVMVLLAFAGYDWKSAT